MSGRLVCPRGGVFGDCGGVQGVYPRGCPGVNPGGILHTPAHMDTPSVNRQTPVKTLPSPILRMQSVIIFSNFRLSWWSVYQFEYVPCLCYPSLNRYHSEELSS